MPIFLQNLPIAGISDGVTPLLQSTRIRKILVEASWFAIKKDDALKAIFERIAVKRGKKRAIIAIARKLIGRIRACFRQEVTYQLGVCM
ncbi:hypothetical protein WDW37_17145 [Bdellovibrionota bacterium FG-1]